MRIHESIIKLPRCRGSFVFALLLAVLTSCSDGGGGGGPSGPRVVGIVAVVGAVSVTLYSESGAPSPSTDLGDLTELRIRFSAPVTPTSLPPNGPTQSGAIRIAGGVDGSVPAVGTWSIAGDDPTTVIFRPAGPQALCVPLLAFGVSYTIEVLGADTDPALAVDLSGVKLARTVTGNFRYFGNPPTTGGPIVLLDWCPTSAPLIVGTTPVMAPDAPAVDPSTLNSGTGARISVDISEPLQPNTLVFGAVQIFDITNPSQSFPLAAQVLFQQSGSFGHPNPATSRILLETTLPLPAGRTYELRISTATPPIDLSNLAMSDIPGRFRFSTSSSSAPTDFLIADDFSSTTNLGSVSGFVAWTGNGVVAAQNDGKLLSNGMAGVVAFTTSANVNTNTNQGVFNATALSIGNNVTLTLTSTTSDPLTATSTWAARFLAQSTISIGASAIIDASGRNGVNSQVNSQTPGFGGWGGPGGGAGGNSTPNPIFNVSDPMGAPGQGGKVDDIVNTGQFADRFGGGGGGISGPLSTLGASGGGGGSASNMASFAATAGESQNGLGAPVGGSAGPLPAAFIPPIPDVLGGSGGGAGGDRQDGVDPATHDRGGAGAGGGGAVLISAMSAVTMGSFVEIRVRGGVGGVGPLPFGGDGGGGSGGSVMIRSLTEVTLSSGSQFSALGGTASNNTLPLDGDGGSGGAGLIQFEDGDGIIPGLAQSLVIGESSVGATPFGQSVIGTARSIVFDSGSLAPEYLASNSLGATGFITNSFNVGTIVVNAVGIRENPSAPGQPAIADPALVSMPVALTDIAQLNGYRFIRFEITTSFAVGDLANPSAILPACESIAIAYRR